jgi:ParB-like nuclease domain
VTTSDIRSPVLQGPGGDGPVGDGVVMLPLDQVDAATDNPRGAGVGDVDRLAASIAQVGVLQPITVTPAKAAICWSTATGAAPRPSRPAGPPSRPSFRR